MSIEGTKGYTAVFTEHVPSWLNKVKNLELLGNEEFLEIIHFYLVHTIVPNTSARSYSINDYQWKTWGDTLLTKKLEKQLGKRFKSVKAKEFEDYAEDFNLIDETFYRDTSQRILYVNKGGKYNGFFAHIRNALAHGRFGVFDAGDGRKVFVFEDGRNKDKKFSVNARIVINRDTLLEIMRIIREDANKEYNAILSAIKNGAETRRRIIEITAVEESEYNRIIDELKKDKKIEKQKNIWKYIETQTEERGNHDE